MSILLGRSLGHPEQEAVCLICWLNNQHKQLEINWSVHTLMPLPSGKKHEAIGGKPRNREGTRNMRQE